MNYELAEYKPNMLSIAYAGMTALAYTSSGALIGGVGGSFIGGCIGAFAGFTGGVTVTLLSTMPVIIAAGVGTLVLPSMEQEIKVGVRDFIIMTGGTIINDAIRKTAHRCMKIGNHYGTIIGGVTGFTAWAYNKLKD